MKRDMIRIEGLTKTFTLHTQGGIQIPVFRDLNLTIRSGACTALHGRSGSGKSTLLRSLYANYIPQRGRIQVRHDGDWVDLTTAPARVVLDVRRRTLGYVSQFLRVIPRISAEEVVAEPLRSLGTAPGDALARARDMLARLNLPERLWRLAPATFSGGEQQRVNIARSFAVDYPVLLLDEPTASLDAGNRQIVINLIQDAKRQGAAIVGIFHDDEVRESVADRIIDVEAVRNAA